MPDEPSQDTQTTQPHLPIAASLDDTLPHLPALDDTQAHQGMLDATLPHPDLEDTQPSQLVIPPRRPSRRQRLLADLRKVALLTGALAFGVAILLVAMYRVAPPPRTNILVMGIDSRPGEGWLARSDSMMLVTIDPERMYVGMLSIPRDLYVNIPGYGNNRINVAHILGEEERAGGGPALSARTIEQDFGVPVQRTVRLRFDGFVRIVDAAGGIDINVQRRLVDTSYPTSTYGVTTVVFEKGWQHMDGQRALEYARTRHSDSDFYRAERQQEVLTALMSKLAAPQNWLYWPAESAAIAESLDTNISLWDAIVLAPTVLWVGPSGFDRQEIDDHMATGFVTKAGADVLAPHWDLIKPLIDKMFRN